MIVIINGPLGVGKTTTAWELLWRFERAVMLDGDHVAAFHPFDYYNQAHLDYAHATFQALVAHHRAHGYADFVLNWVFETPAGLADLKQRLAAFGLPIQAYRLVCDPAEIARRIRKRNLSNLAFELQRGPELAAILDRAAQTGDLGYPIDTTHRSVEQTVEAIWQHLLRILDFRLQI